jgi:agmatine deiminase
MGAEPGSDQTGQQAEFANGFRLPAEWEPVERVWLSEPANPDTWPGCLAEARAQWRAMRDAMRPYVETRSTQEAGIATDDAWIRDYGPIFVVHAEKGIACHDFVFNCWGGKYEPYDRDDVVPRRIAAELGVPVWEHEFVLEGGAIDVNGRGTVMTTEQCLLKAGRNPGMGREGIEGVLHRALGTRHVIWLPGGIVGDDTDGHIDDVARFIAPGRVAAVRAKEGQTDYDVLERNWWALKASRDQDGARLELVALPAPEPLYYDYPDEERVGGTTRLQLPASYANFLIANRALFVPVFGQPADEKACRRLEDAMPGYSVVPVRSEHLVVGLGAIHCLSMQQPEGVARRGIS